MKNILNNKFVVIALITAILIVTLCTNTFAATSDVNKNSFVMTSNNSFTITDFRGNEHNFVLSDYIMSFKYIAIYYNQSSFTGAGTGTVPTDSLSIFFSNEEFMASINEASNGNIAYEPVLNSKMEDFLAGSISYGECCPFFYYKNNIGYHVTYDAVIDKILNFTEDDISSSYNFYNLTPVYSNFNLLDTEGNVVFQGAPQMPAITKTLVEQTTQTQIAEQLKTMITGFLKYLIALVISVIAFWKGWKFLSQQFKKA